MKKVRRWPKHSRIVLIKASYKDSENWPRLVQISWILTDAKGTILEATDYVVRPEHFTIPQEATNIHGITNRMAKEEGYKLRKVLLRFLEMLDKCDFIVGHNIDFDVNVIAAELYRKELPASAHAFLVYIYQLKRSSCDRRSFEDRVVRNGRYISMGINHGFDHDITSSGNKEMKRGEVTKSLPLTIKSVGQPSESDL